MIPSPVHGRAGASQRTQPATQAHLGPVGRQLRDPHVEDFELPQVRLPHARLDAAGAETAGFDGRQSTRKAAEVGVWSAAEACESRRSRPV